MAPKDSARHPDALTPREDEVLNLIRQNRTNPEIAEALNISTETVKQHVSQILAKLNVTTREQAAVWRQPERQRWPARRWAIALGGTAVIAATIAALALLTWGVVRSNAGEGVLGANSGTQRDVAFLSALQSQGQDVANLVTADIEEATWADITSQLEGQNIPLHDMTQTQPDGSQLPFRPDDDATFWFAHSAWLRDDSYCQHEYYAVAEGVKIGWAKLEELEQCEGSLSPRDRTLIASTSDFPPGYHEIRELDGISETTHQDATASLVLRGFASVTPDTGSSDATWLIIVTAYQPDVAPATRGPECDQFASLGDSSSNALLATYSRSVIC